MRTVVLIIKGREGEVQEAAKQRGIALDTCEQRLVVSEWECLCKASYAYFEQIVKWFCEVGKAPYPVGTCLFYNELTEHKPGQILNGTGHDA